MCCSINFLMAIERVVLLGLVLGFQGVQVMGGVCVNELRRCQTQSIGLPECDDFNLSGMSRNLFCQALEFASTNGCFCTSQEGLEEWSTLGTTVCNLDLFLPHSLLCFSAAGHSSKQTTWKISSKFSASTSESSSIQEPPALKEKNISTSSLTAMQTLKAAGGFFLLSCAIICPCIRVKKKETERVALGHAPLSMDSISSFEASSTSEFITASPRRYTLSPRQSSTAGAVAFTIAQISKATHNFSLSLKVGQGGFGMVFRGQLDDGRIVAIKRAKKSAYEARLTAEFRNEVGMLARIEHLNLVKLIGYCEQENEHILVTEYVQNGTLREHLDGLRGTYLDLSTRLDIAIDVAHALTYLHLYADQPIIHRDVKSSNILLTENFRAKVADFGFSRTGPLDANETHVSTQVKGTAGYLDPEYLKTYQLTQKSDVYSFGILLLEILTGRRPIEMKRDIEERITVRWAFKKTNEGKASEILDARLVEGPGIDMVAEKMFELAFQCSAPTRSDRPSMNQAAEQLWAIRKNYQSLKSEAPPNNN